MIQANELSPNNFINYRDTLSGQTRIVQINALKKSIASFQEKHEERIEIWLPLLNCEGIPITDEWLKKLGFESYGDSRHIVSSKTTVKFRIWHQKGEYIERHDGGTDRILYVHQLQNLYNAICGEELIYKIS